MGCGAWEVQHSLNKLVLCATIHTEVTTIAWALSLRKLQIPGEMIGVTGMPYDHARNSCVQYMLNNGYQYIFFLDSDVLCPHDTIHKLLRWQTPIVGATYCRRSPPHGVPVAIKNGTWLPNLPAPGGPSLVEVDFMGAGAMLVHRSVFEKPHPDSIPGKPWFHWKVDQMGFIPQGEALSEDFAWNAKVRKMGYKIFLDSSIRCLHVGYSQADFGTLLPLQNVG